jgi:hypothetical protein
MLRTKTMSENTEPKSFEEFWDFYVRAHSNPTNRKLHFIGTSLAFGCVAGAALTRRKSLLLAAPVLGYGFAWVGHFVFEKNKPASFDHPLWSFKADMKMWAMIATGKMDAEVERVMAGAPAPEREEAPVGANGTRVETQAN